MPERHQRYVAPVMHGPQVAPPGSPPDPAIARYRACTARIAHDAEGAVAEANSWRTEGGGLAARQCLGLALAQLERWNQAATAFEQGAHDAESANDARRADFWVQAGNAWLAGGDGQRAMADFDAALLSPGLTDQLRGETRLDRGRAQVALGNLPAARNELDLAERLVPADAMAWYLSAALARRESNPARAATDIARARTLAPDNADIALLAGTIAGQGGNMEEAERLYRLVVQQAPDSPAGRAAAASLATAHDVEVPAGTTPAPPPNGTAPATQPTPPATPHR
jgi:tetratricopeptide (TPR) repeat protein